MIQLELSDSILTELFSVVDTGHLRNLDSSRPFNFINNDSDTLTVTVGDSWTWGADMTATDDSEHRLKYNFGRIVADHLQSDWLSLGQCGSGNIWLCQRVEELCNMIPNLHYKKIYLICTFTEVGRGVDAHRHIDYVDFFKTNPPNRLVEFLNQHAVERILAATKKFPHMVLKIGTNFVDHIGIGSGDYVLPDPWTKLCCMNYNIEYTDQAYSVSSWAVNAMRSLEELVPPENKNKFLQYLTDLLEPAKARQRLLIQIPGMRHAHPNKVNHKIWADYIIQQL